MSEYITGLRALIGNAPVNLMGAAGLIFDARGHVLLQRLVGRDDVWSLCGGLCELAEPPLSTLRREVWEETGLRVEQAEFISLHTAPLQTLSNGHQAAFYTALYRVTQWSGTPRPDGAEVERLAWFDPGHLPPMRGVVGRWAAEWLSVSQLGPQ